MPKPPKPAYKASDISQTKMAPDLTTKVFQVVIHNPDGRGIMTINGESAEMVRMASGAVVAAFNKVLGN